MCIKKKILFASIIFAISATVIGQPILKDSEDAYNYWAKRGIIEMVYAFMNDYIETVSDSIRNKKEIEGKETYFFRFVDKIDDKSIEQISVEYDKLPEFLINTNWSGTEKKLLRPLIKQFIDSYQIDSTFFNTTKTGSTDLVTDIPEYTNKLKNWSNVQQRIINSYNESLNNLDEKRISPDKNIIENEPKNEKSNKSQQPRKRVPPNEIISGFDWLNIVGFIILFLFALLIGSIIIYSITRRKIYSILKSEREKYLDEMQENKKEYFFNYIGLVEMLKERKDFYKECSEGNVNPTQQNEIRELKKQVDRLVKDNNELNRNPLSIKKTDSNNKESHTQKSKSTNEKRIEIDLQIDQPKKSNSVLYFSIPENDGRFIISKGESSNDGRNFYKVEFLENSNEGQLFFISSNQDKRAINRLETYLKPVCEIENFSNANSTNRIELIKHGKVIFRNESWIIDSDRKVKIKLI